MLRWRGPQLRWRVCFYGLPALRTEHLVCFFWPLLQPLPDGLTPALHHHAWICHIFLSQHRAGPMPGPHCQVPAGMHGYLTSINSTSQVCELHAVGWPRAVICMSLLVKAWGPVPELPLPISSELLLRRPTLSDCASRCSDTSVQSAITQDSSVHMQSLTFGAWLPCTGKG